jgi:hypothetical protein
MPYKIRKQKCKKSSGGSGTYVMSYVDKKGKKHRNCHSSKKSARGQIAAIEMEEGMIREIISLMLGENFGNFENCFKITEGYFENFAENG